MDPLSITVASISLAKLCSTIAAELGTFIQSIKDVDRTIVILQGDVQGYKIVLDLLHDIVNIQDIKDWIASTSRIETYWTSLEASLRDAAITLNSLKTKTERINKPSLVFYGTRKQRQMMFAVEEIDMYRQQIARFNGILQVVLNTTTMHVSLIYTVICVLTLFSWYHVSHKQASQPVPRLNKTQMMIRELGVHFNNRMAALQVMIQSQPTSNSLNTDAALLPKIEYLALDNMRNCLRGAATIIVSASTIAGNDAWDDSATLHGSDFDDIFELVSSDQTLHWIKKDAIPEKGENDAHQERSLMNIAQSLDELEISGELKDDQGLKWEMRIASLESGSQCTDQGRWKEAQTHLTNSIDGLLEDQVLAKAPKNWLEFTIITTALLCEVFYHFNRWKELQAIYKRRLYNHSRLQNRGTETEIEDKLNLSRALYECGEYRESLLYCRSAEIEHRKLGKHGLHGRIGALRLIAKVQRQLGSEIEAQRSEALAEDLSPKKFHKSSAQDIKPPRSSNNIDIQALKKSLLGSSDKASTAKSSPLPENVFDNDEIVIKKSFANPKTERAHPATVTDAIKESVSFLACRRAKVIFDFKGRDDHELNVLEDDQLAILYKPDKEYYTARSLKDEREGDIPQTYVNILERDVWIEAHKVDYAFKAEGQGELSVAQDDHVQVLKRDTSDWSLVMLRSTGQQGWIPASYISPYILQDQDSETSRPDVTKVRRWQGSRSALAVDAEFCGFKNGDVCLHRVNEVMITLPRWMLSAVDMKYVEDLFRQNLWA